MRFEPGQELASQQVTVTVDQINAYAEASGDHNPIHLDDGFARSVGLPGVIAHGMLQMGRLATYVTGLTGDHRRIRSLRCRFAGMVRPGDVITFGGRVTAVDAGVATLELWAQNQDGARVLTKASAQVE